MSDEYRKGLITCFLCGQEVDKKEVVYGSDILITRKDISGDDVGRAFDLQKEQFKLTSNELLKKGIKLKTPSWQILPVYDSIGQIEWVIKWIALKEARDE